MESAARKASKAKYHQAHKDEINKRHRENYYQTKDERKKVQKKYMESKGLNTRYIQRYGITLEQYNEMFKKQDGKCAICLKTEDRRLAVDHCHKTGKVRQLLCTNCNQGLGQFFDDKDLLQKALNYLDLHQW